MENKIKAGIIAIILLSGLLIFKLYLQETEPYACSSNSDCVIKESQCGSGCFHKDEEPKNDSSVRCDYRPWFKKERCECVKSHCMQITCEAQGLDYSECSK